MNQDATPDLVVNESVTSTPGSRDQADLTCGAQERPHLAALEDESARLEEEIEALSSGAGG